MNKETGRLSPQLSVSIALVIIVTQLAVKHNLRKGLF